MDIIDKFFEKMERKDYMDYELFDLEGINYCPVDGTITLKKFIDDDNKLKFYSFVKKVKVRKKFSKNHGEKIAVDFELFFQNPITKSAPSLECVWIFGVSKEQKITMIDSFWDVDQFKKNLEMNYPDFLKLFFRS